MTWGRKVGRKKGVRNKRISVLATQEETAVAVAAGENTSPSIDPITIIHYCDSQRSTGLVGQVPGTKDLALNSLYVDQH